LRDEIRHTPVAPEVPPVDKNEQFVVSVSAKMFDDPLGREFFR
jgi:hypothetical protein